MKLCRTNRAVLLLLVALSVSSDDQRCDPLERGSCPCESRGISFCWETYPGDEEILEHYNHALYGDPSADFQLDATRWTSTATDAGPLGLGDGMTLTYSFVPDGTPIPSTALGEPAAASDLFATFDALYGSTANWQAMFHAAFQRWGDLTGVTYVFEANEDVATPLDGSGQPGALGVRGDIRIGGKNIDGATGFNILAANFFPGQGGDMILDTSNTAFFAQGPAFLENVVTHEHGHGLGLRHVCPIDGTKLMEPAVTTAFSGPQHDDIRGAQRLYGDAMEPNDEVMNASSLGNLSWNGPIVFSDMSTDDDSDEDWYSFTVPGTSVLDVTLRPVGFVYNQTGEGLGTCPGGAPIDSSAISDLTLEVFDSDGVTLIGSSATSPAGHDEAILCLTLPNLTGPFYIRVTPDTTDDVQLYEIEVEVRDGVLEVPQDFSSIQGAIDAACGGELILVSPGTWGAMDFRGKDLRIVSVSGPAVTFVSQAAIFFNGESRSALLEGFTFLGSGFLPFEPLAEGVFCALGSSPTIRRCVFDGTHRVRGGGGVAAINGAAPLIESCLFNGCSAEATGLFSSEGGGAVFADFAAPELLNCTIVNCFLVGALGGTVGGAVFGPVQLTNCVVRNNLPDQLAGGATAGSSNIQGGFAGSGNIDVDPGFIDPDFRLDACSAAGVDLGVVVSGVGALDLGGNPRVLGVLDMGAFEERPGLRGTMFPDIDMRTTAVSTGRTKCRHFPDAGESFSLLFTLNNPSFIGETFVLLGGVWSDADLPPEDPTFPGTHVFDPDVLVLLVRPWDFAFGESISSIPLGLGGLTLRYQAFLTTSLATNGVFEATDAHEVILP